MRFSWMVTMLVAGGLLLHPSSLSAAAPQSGFVVQVYLSLDPRFQEQTKASKGETLRSLTGRLLPKRHRQAGHDHLPGR